MWMLMDIALAVCGTDDLTRVNQAAQSAFVLGDRAALRHEVRAVERLPDCPTVTAEQAHLYHLTLALGEALVNDWQGAEERLAASVAAMPTAELRGPVAEDYRFKLAFQRAQERTVTWAPYERGPRNGGELPVIPDTLLVQKRSTAKTPLRLVALGAGLAAGGLYAGAMVSRAEYGRVSGGAAKDVLPVYRRTNALATASTAALGVGVVCLGVSFAVR